MGDIGFDLNNYFNWVTSKHADITGMFLHVYRQIEEE